MRNLLMLMTTLALIGGCKQREEVDLTAISLDQYEKFEADTSGRFIVLNIVKVYPANQVCIGEEKYANLYIARQKNGQALYIFEYCTRVSKLIYDTIHGVETLINPTNILHDVPKKVNVFVPKKFTIPTGAKYVFTELVFRTES